MKILQKLIATGLIALLNLTSIAQAAETVTYFHNDLLGSPAAATDESGEIIWRENYRPFGEKVKNQDEKTDNVIGYTGHVHDEDTGLTYMQARYYDPVIGRFYANDPVGFVQSNPLSFNRYKYANNNPYKFVDPDGNAEYFAFNGAFIESVRPEDNNVYVRNTSSGTTTNTSLDISPEDFHTIAATVYGEGPAVGRTVAESTATANVINNQGARRGESMLESATSGRFFGSNNDAAQDYLANWRHGGATEAPAARAGVISVLAGDEDPIDGRSMFEGIDLLSSDRSNFQGLYVDTGVAYDPTDVGNTRYYRERTREEAQAQAQGNN